MQFIVKFSSNSKAAAVFDAFSLRSTVYVPHNAYVITSTGAVAEQIKSMSGNGSID